MLILSRKSGESIVIGEDVEVVVTSVRRDSARIGVKAPPETVILRKEIQEKREERDDS